MRALLPLLLALLVPALLGASGPEDAYDVARKAQIAAAKKDTPEAWAEAAEAFEDYLRRYGKHRLASEARFGLAECLVAAGEPARAMGVYGELRVRGVGSREGDLLSGEAFALHAMVESGGSEDTEEEFLDKVRELRRADPRHDRLPPLLAATARVYRRRGDRGEAAEALAELVETWPGHELAENAWDDLGALRFDRGDWDGAIKSYRGYLEHFPEGQRELEIRCLLAFAYLQQGNAADAVVAGERLMEKLNPRRHPEQQALWNETVRILSQATARDLLDLGDVRKAVSDAPQAWTIEVVVGALAVRAEAGDVTLAVDGLLWLSDNGHLEIDKASPGMLEQMVLLGFALREVAPGDEQVQRWLLVTARALDALDRRGEAGELLQWLRNEGVTSSIRREARERQLRDE